jgi:hypothetical protein
MFSQSVALTIATVAARALSDPVTRTIGRHEKENKKMKSDCTQRFLMIYSGVLTAVFVRP